ncbi:DUF6895 family protein [Streptomyces sp. NPDC101213]|uniref:DUF6895 family protein n=1 Tax=Streptomyces sp. NPDC101213 TaxID=3366130 RepID=UPI003806B93E
MTPPAGGTGPGGTPAHVRTARRVEEGALAWVSAHREHFALGADALAPDGAVNGSWKPLGELARVCASLSPLTPPRDPLHAPVRDLLAYAWRQTGEGELFARLQRLEPFATYPLEVYAAFASAGLRHPGYEAAAATVARSRGWQLAEQDPTRRLGVLAAERRIGLHRHGDDRRHHDAHGHDAHGHDGVRPHDGVRRSLGRTWLGGLPEPWAFERFSGYALTHVVFHLTDWGRRPAGVPADLREYLADWLPAWLDTCLDAGMWDLGCELLAVAASLPEPLSPAAAGHAWDRIAAARHAGGALPEQRGSGTADPAPPGAPSEPVRSEPVPFEPARSEPAASGPAPDFPHCYHSTLMAAFAAALTVGQHHRGDGAPAPYVRPEGALG